MENFTGYQILAAVIVAILGSTVVAALINVGKQLVDERKKDKAEQASKVLNEAVELKRLGIEADHVNEEAIKDAIWKLYNDARAELDKLKGEFESMEKSHSLSRPTILKIYTSIRTVRKQIDIIDLLVMKQAEHSDLTLEVEILRQNLDELENHLP